MSTEGTEKSNFPDRKRFVSTEEPGGKFNFPLTTEQISKHCQLVKQYKNLRTKGDLEGIMKLVSDQMTVVSERDGTHTGRQEFRAYLEKVEPTGTWQEPVDVAPNKTCAQGVVNVFWIDWDVLATFEFDDHDLITKLEIKRGILE